LARAQAGIQFGWPDSEAQQQEAQNALAEMENFPE
jgi:hypothetical protein